MDNKEDNKDLKNTLDTFLKATTTESEITCDCEGEECEIRENGELIERVNKKLITQDGRQLLI